MAIESIVYFIRSGADGPVKIGTTHNIADRLDTLQSHSPEPLSVMRTVPGGYLVEQWLHDRFADQRLHREWFAFSELMLDIIPPGESSLRTHVGNSERARTYAGVVLAFVRKHYLPLKGATALMASDAGMCTTPRTAENWLAGTHAPNGEKLINLMAANPELEAEILRLVAERRAARGER